MDIVIAQCGNDKVDTRESDTPHSVQARELYVSTYFQLKREYADTFSDEFVIISAKHGFVHETEDLQYYDETADSDDFDRDAWESLLAQQAAGDTLAATEDIKWALRDASRIILLASKSYASAAVNALTDSPLVDGEIHTPFQDYDAAKGGIGHQMGWLRDMIDSGTALPTDTQPQERLGDY